MRLSTFLTIAVPTEVVRGYTMANFQVPDAVQSSFWRASLSSSWDVSLDEFIDVRCNLKCSKVLGPFPIHAREQHFLSPSYPLNRRPPFRFSCDGGV